ncbi:class II aldolase/adducin family protein [Pseudofrankia asymbiotica]|uniref:Class II aldolase/adducin family protein n=1 Tax=Pseudofrankia asymbiotica TaxID=1834516 RepID=A0A1V2I8T0_9ACTN|nr:class II aldolase/adducin family protein [Pseudofrankia asymbiotica]ONH27152.1 class II aldolase/adducin family protein [Pseudofrankia asymbiotica]
MTAVPLRATSAAPAIAGPWPRAEPERTLEQERLHRKQRLAGAYRIFGQLGYGEGIAGHITARDPELTDHFWVNRFGVDFRRVTVSNLLLVDSGGEIVEGQPPLNKAAFAIHSEVHAARPDVVAAAHTHSLYGKALSTLGEPLYPITQDACAFYQDHAIFDDYTGVVLSTDEGRRIAEALGRGKLAILANHGLLTVGTTVESAAYWFITAERAAQTQLIAQAGGRPRPLDDVTAERTARQIGGETLARWGFEALYQIVVEEQPDLLD